MTYRPIPQPDSRTSLRALQALLKHRTLLSALQVFNTQLGDVFQIKLPGMQMVMLTGAEANRFVLVTARDKLLWRTESDPVTTLLREGILVVDGAVHDALRRTMNAPLHRKALTHYVTAMCDCTDRVTDAWTDGAEVDALVEMRKIALMILTETLFNVNVTPEIDHLWQPILKSIQYISPGLWILWNRIPRLGYSRHLKTLNEYLHRIIAHRRTELNTDDDDLLSILIHAGLSDDSIRDQLLTMLIAGHDTSTALLTWAIYLLTTHPDALVLAREEVQRVLGGQPPTIDHVGELVYLGQVIDETLRLYPPIHIGSRKVAEDLEFDGYLLSAGIRVMYSIYLTHHHPAYWESPDAFDPERFNRDNKRQIPPYAYLPFGGGARNCIGTAFALVEAKIILARILQLFDLAFTGHHVSLKMGATLEPHPGVRVRVKRKTRD